MLALRAAGNMRAPPPPLPKSNTKCSAPHDDPIFSPNVNFILADDMDIVGGGPHWSWLAVGRLGEG
eukprot:4319257-Pyramimonas_sp.AAC.1